MTTGQDLLKRASDHLGEKYAFVVAPKDNPNWKGPWDCAELVSWIVYQETKKLYGCTNNAAAPDVADAYTNSWKRDVLAGDVTRVSVEEAAVIPGAILLRFPGSTKKMGHIVFSAGDGRTVEAMDEKNGVARGRVERRHWDAGVLIPGVTYDRTAEVQPVPGPTVRYALNVPNMSRTVVAELQKTLRQNGFDPGPIDGEFGERTAEAVAAFQAKAGLVRDGEVGEQTAKALGINLLGAAAAAAGAVIKGVLGSNPLLAVAAAIFPEIAKAIAGDKTGAVAGQAARAVSDVTGASEAGVAKATLAADPEATAALQAKLAEIALAQEESRRKAEAEERAAQDAAAAETRKAEFERFKASLKDVAGARDKATEWAKLGGPMSWGAPAVSVIVVLGFFGFLAVLLIGANLFDFDANQPAFQILNITVGALTAAFSTVVSFWLGSSEGSRAKDAINAGTQIRQAEQTQEAEKTRNEFAERMVSKVSEAASASAANPTAREDGPGSKPANFQRCLDLVLAKEGGYGKHPEDNGGATNLGITLETLKAWRRNDGKPGNDEVTDNDVATLKLEEARDIYRTNYWNALRCDELPAGLDLMVFDFGVNAGVATSARMLQKIVGAEADGSIGPRTIAAAKAGSARETISLMAKARLKHYERLADWKTFGNGWTNRTKAVEAAALAMATS